jgi:undecaprenyl pyrophosphate phosphatase UppP
MTQRAAVLIYFNWQFLDTIEPLRREHKKEKKMLWTIAIILTVLWLLGLVSSYTMGGLIHILLVIAIVVILIQVIQGRRL